MRHGGWATPGSATEEGKEDSAVYATPVGRGGNDVAETVRTLPPVPRTPRGVQGEDAQFATIVESMREGIKALVAAYVAAERAATQAGEARADLQAAQLLAPFEAVLAESRSRRASLTPPRDTVPSSQRSAKTRPRVVASSRKSLPTPLAGAPLPTPPPQHPSPKSAVAAGADPPDLPGRVKTLATAQELNASLSRLEEKVRRVAGLGNGARTWVRR
jgi:hypothetical protein